MPQQKGSGRVLLDCTLPPGVAASSALLARLSDLLQVCHLVRGHKPSPDCSTLLGGSSAAGGSCHVTAAAPAAWLAGAQRCQLARRDWRVHVVTEGARRRALQSKPPGPWHAVAGCLALRRLPCPALLQAACGGCKVELPSLPTALVFECAAGEGARAARGAAHKPMLSPCILWDCRCCRRHSSSGALLVRAWHVVRSVQDARSSAVWVHGPGGDPAAMTPTMVWGLPRWPAPRSPCVPPVGDEAMQPGEIGLGRGGAAREALVGCQQHSRTQYRCTFVRLLTPLPLSCQQAWSAPAGAPPAPRCTPTSCLAPRHRRRRCTARQRCCSGACNTSWAQPPRWPAS